MSPRIEVHQKNSGEPLRFSVTVREGGSASHHDVTMSAAMRAEHARDTPEQMVEAAFRFLLDREAKESILSRFDLSQIARYFPEFERSLPDYLA